MNERPNDRLNEIQFQRNRRTRGDWDVYASHREQTTSLILEAAGEKEKPSLCILGVGNGNDVDFGRLAERFDSTTLVDLDGEALQHLCGRLVPADSERIRVVSGIDLSGLFDWLPHLATSPQGDETWQAARNVAGSPSEAKQLGSFDVVASTCLLTQMIDSVATALGSDHAGFADLAHALRDGHLHLLAELCNPAGRAVFITDCVSSDTLPELAVAPDEQLEPLLVAALKSGNLFVGTSPASVGQQFQKHGASLVNYGPWRWRMGPRTFAVYGLRLAMA